jgi:hypothetical protein
MGLSPVTTINIRTRSKVTNGRALFDGDVDGRSAWARRLRDLIRLYVCDMGGEDAVSAAEHSLARRAATLTLELELLEKKFALANGAKPNDLDLYTRTAGGLRRLLESVGLKRIPRDVTPTYLDLDKTVEGDDTNSDDAE